VNRLGLALRIPLEACRLNRFFRGHSLYSVKIVLDATQASAILYERIIRYDRTVL